MLSKRFRKRLLAMIGAALAFVLVSYFKKLQKNV